MKTIVLVAMILIGTLYADAQDTKYLGVLETKGSLWPDEKFNAIEDSSRKKVVRVLFRYEDYKWYSLERDLGNSKIYPRYIDWLISFKGEKMGEFSSSKAAFKFEKIPWTWPRDGYHTPDTQKLPTIGNPSKEFSGFDMEEHPRPLVVISDTNLKDTDDWVYFEQEKPEAQELSKLYNNYILHYYNLDRFFSSTNSKVPSVQFLTLYKSSKNDQLLQLGTLIDDVEEGQNAVKIWVFKSYSGEIINLSKAVDYPHRHKGDAIFSNLTLVDTGDYDKDGQSDAIFWIDRYNGNGYVLFYNNFSNSVIYEWSYH